MPDEPIPGSTPSGVNPANPTPPLTGAAPIDYGQAPSSVPYMGPPPDQDSKTMGMLAHLLGALTGFLGPLIIWLIKREQSPFVNDQGKEALNWEITVCIGYVVIGIASGILGHILFILGCLGNLLLLAAWALNLVFAIQGAIAANKGIAYRYPFSLRLIK